MNRFEEVYNKTHGKISESYNGTFNDDYNGTPDFKKTLDNLYDSVISFFSQKSEEFNDAYFADFQEQAEIEDGDLGPYDDALYHAIQNLAQVYGDALTYQYKRDHQA